MFDGNLTCVQMDDDLNHILWWTMNGYQQVQITVKTTIASMFDLLESEDLYLGGGRPTRRVWLSHTGLEAEFRTNIFIMGSFMVIRPTHLRLNEEMGLKEDYDYTMQHIREYGGALRICWLGTSFKHYKKRRRGHIVQDP